MSESERREKKCVIVCLFTDLHVVTNALLVRRKSKVSPQVGKKKEDERREEKK